MYALTDIRQLYEQRDEAGFSLRFVGKYDPLNPMQAALVDKVYSSS
jgi:hypothetical protein